MGYYYKRLDSYVLISTERTRGKYQFCATRISLMKVIDNVLTDEMLDQYVNPYPHRKSEYMDIIDFYPTLNEFIGKLGIVGYDTRNDVYAINNALWRYNVAIKNSITDMKQTFIDRDIIDTKDYSLESVYQAGIKLYCKQDYNFDDVYDRLRAANDLYIGYKNYTKERDTYYKSTKYISVDERNKLAEIRYERMKEIIKNGKN